MLPEIVVKFLAEIFGCVSNNFVLLKTINVGLEVLDGREHHVNGGVGRQVGHLFDGLEQGKEFLNEGEVILVSISVDVVGFMTDLKFVKKRLSHPHDGVGSVARIEFSATKSEALTTPLHDIEEVVLAPRKDDL